MDHFVEPSLWWPKGNLQTKNLHYLKKTALYWEYIFAFFPQLTVFFSLPGSTGDGVKSRAVPQQPPFLSSRSDAVQHHGCSPCWTVPHFCSCDHYYVCSRFCFLWRYVHSCQNQPLHCDVLWWIHSTKPQICWLSPSLSVILLSVAGLTLLSVLSGLALFSILVSFIVNAFYFVIFKIFKYYHLAKVMYCKLSFSYFNNVLKCQVTP